MWASCPRGQLGVRRAAISVSSLCWNASRARGCYFAMVSRAASAQEKPTSDHLLLIRGPRDRSDTWHQIESPVEALRDCPQVWVAVSQCRSVASTDCSGSGSLPACSLAMSRHTWAGQPAIASTYTCVCMAVIFVSRRLLCTTTLDPSFSCSIGQAWSPKPATSRTARKGWPTIRTYRRPKTSNLSRCRGRPSPGFPLTCNHRCQ